MPLQHSWEGEASGLQSLVHPHIEYCSSVWDPNTKRYIQKVEAVQRRAARFITNDYGLWPRKLRYQHVHQPETSCPSAKTDHDAQDRTQQSRPQPWAAPWIWRPWSSHSENQESQPTHSQSSMNQDWLLSETFFPNTATDWNSLPYSK